MATLVGGDDHVTEQEAAEDAAIREALRRHAPSLVLTGPAFESGRDGLGCALVCRVTPS